MPIGVDDSFSLTLPSVSDDPLSLVGPASPYRRLRVSGDGSPEADLLVAASRRQRHEAALRLEDRLPGFAAEARMDRCGLDTPTLLNVPSQSLDLPDIQARIDAYLASGDLGADRCQMVDDVAARGVPVGERHRSPRTGPSSSLALDPFAVVDALRSKNTIVLNEAESRLGHQVTDLCHDMGVAFRAHVQTNCYVSVGEATGFGLHWDNHDVVVVQVAGRKYWEIESPSEFAPVKDFNPAGGSGDSVWSGVLTPGAALAIPRGWPHAVQGIADELSAHLTISIGRPSAIGLLNQLPPGYLTGEHRAEDELLDLAWGLWNSRLASYPRNGPLEVLGAQAVGYDGCELRVAMLGGAVFVPDLCDHTMLTLVGPRGPFQLPRASAAGLAVGLESQWWTVEQLMAAASISRESAHLLVETLGRASSIQLRAAA